MKQRLLDYIKKNNLQHIYLFNYLDENSSSNVYNAKADSTTFRLANNESITLKFNPNTFKWSL